MSVATQTVSAAATLAFAAVALVVGARATEPPPPPDPPIVVRHQAERCTIAAIGDYGDHGPSQAAVAALVHGWAPDVVITLGDNNYPSGASTTIDANIGQYYRRYIAPYRGGFGEGASDNRFFPSLGNHDWRATAAAPYLEYFDLPGNERYYDLRWGPVHLFAIDSDRHEPDGVGADGAQARWLRDALRASQAPWKLVYMHHPPYSSGEHGGAAVMRWPFAEWGVDAVVAGHDHHYERLQRDGIVYFVGGTSGSPSLYPAGKLDPASSKRVFGHHGAIRIDADASSMTFQFITDTGERRDSFTLTQGSPAPRPSSP